MSSSSMLNTILSLGIYTAWKDARIHGHHHGVIDGAGG